MIMTLAYRIVACMPPLLLASCAFLPRPATTPVRTELHAPEGKPTELLVLLPGRHSLPSEFKREGFLDLVRQKYPGARIAIPDLHIGYYRKRSATQRLHNDIIAPAKAEGIDKLTLVGISMGGLGAILYDLEHPEVDKSLVLLSPFVGDEAVIDDISRQGLANWQPVGPEPDRFSRRLWKEIRQQWMHEGRRPDIALGCGESDRLALTSRLLQREFGLTSNAYWIPGDHDWPTWNDLYARVK